MSSSSKEKVGEEDDSFMDRLLALQAKINSLDTNVFKISKSIGVNLEEKNVSDSNRNFAEAEPIEHENIYQKKIPKEMLRKMLIKENELRLSPKVQAIYADYNQHPEKGDWINYTHKLQEHIVSSFDFGGTPDQVRWSVNQLRTATSVYPDLAEIPLYVRFNRAKRGDLREKDVAPSVLLNEVGELGDVSSCRTVDLLSMKQKNRPLVVCAASWT